MSLDNESPIPVPSSQARKSSDLLPRFYRTDANKKFLGATLDQLISPGQVKKISGFIGRQNAQSVKAEDVFLKAADKLRQDYQLEPAAVIEDRFGNVEFFKDYIDHINHIKVLNGITTNHSRLNQEEFYSWNPHIDWDKFVNFQQYYWLPYGPDPIEIVGQQLSIDSTYTVNLEDQGDVYAYLFSPDGLTRNPTLTLYRGQTYRFDITSPENPFVIKNLRTLGNLDVYTNNPNIVSNNFVENGEVVFRVPFNAPDVLYYVSKADPNVGGSIVIKNIEENTFLDVEKEIIGKKNYILPNGLSLSNGMKLSFVGNTNPVMFQEGFWFVEGVGDKIKLVNAKDLEIIGQYTEQDELLFDNDPFDEVPFSTKTASPKSKDYIVINRASNDRNPWSRTNRWFHQDVIKKTAEFRSTILNLDQSARAIRPIIEFNADIKLHNFGHVAKKNVDLIDNFTTDVFSIIEGSLGYNIDGVDITDGMRILFTADPDRLVKGRIFQANFINITNPGRRLNFTANEPNDSTGSVSIQFDTIKCDTDHGLINGDKVVYLSNGNIQLQGLIHRSVYFVKVIDQRTLQLYTDSLLQNIVDILSTGDSVHSLEVFNGLRRQINLVETEDSVPLTYQTVLVNNGISERIKHDQNGNIIEGNQGLMYWFDGDNWKLGPIKLSVNQPPYFDVFDDNGNSFSDKLYYDGSTFKGTKLFSYKLGDGFLDKELNFPISYRNINNIGDIVFEFNLINDIFNYKDLTNVLTKKIDVGYVKKIVDLENFNFENGWIKSNITDAQPVIRIYKNHNIDGVKKGFPIDCFDEHLNLEDLKVKVYVNNKRLFSHEFFVINGPVRKEVFTVKVVSQNDIITLKLYSKQPKNNNGHYEIPINLQNNPLNNNLESFSLGEVIDHVDSIVDNLANFSGQYPGYGNLRDLGNISYFGTRFVQHSAPLNLSLYTLGSKDFNVMKSLEVARNEYSRFKTGFLVLAGEIGIHAEPKQFVDSILTELNRDKPKTDPYFLSDMFAYTANKRFEYKVLDSRTKIYPLNTSFNLNELSNKSVLIYKNNIQLIHGKDYIFNNDFFTILIDIVEDDLIEVYEYENTDGSFCPPTPSKLGIYPAYEPEKYIDNTFLEPTTVIRGHDGSITIGFGDYRDDILLELEKRIYNNIKIKYDTKIFDVKSLIPGHSRETQYNKNEFDLILSQFFFQWTTLIQQDYKKDNSLWDYNNPFTYNYRGFSLADKTTAPSFWRGIYNWLFDTDSPHLRPWESLNYSVKPSWWEEVYGPAPYTSDNYILWDDLRDGIIREPGKTIKVNNFFKRTILQFGKPVDQEGKLLNPIQAGFVTGLINPTEGGYYTFGDQGPVETAWRRSSHYCFSVIQTLILMYPAKVISLCFDKSRISRNLNEQLVYKDTKLRIRLQDLVIPSLVTDNERIYASGLVNYIVDNISVEIVEPIERFKNDLSLITNKLSSRLGGYTSKEKLKIILDSKNPVSYSGVFVPDENYKVFYNKSSPVQELVYSGVLITKYEDGFEVRGYSKDQPYFKFYDWDRSGREINIGGISESYINWDEDQRYIAGQIVKFKESYYRVKVNHTANRNFATDYFDKLKSLPVTGGRNVFLRTSFNTREENILSYGTIFSTIQEVVDFIQGYGFYLKNQGFVFDEYSPTLKLVQNWDTSVKEFVFWTTQNWSVGSAISLSPAANNLVFENDQIPAVVDNIKDTFYGYSIFRVDGEFLASDFTNSYRERYGFTIRPINTNHGLYGAVIRLVQKEHVLLIDNVTLFNDVIYDVEPGYKQDKVKLQGYISTGWDGGFNVPGFIYDEARITDWTPWTDYNLGDIVFFKDFYYSAKRFIPGTELLNEENWIRLENSPVSKLLPNWNYKAEQFTDFYDLDSDNFDSEQQRLAQHLIGYQKRQYLENIIVDDISQYKFYQGMIAEKGTYNVLSKLFDVLSADNKESLTFNEEWAIRVGNYGATSIYDEIEFNLDEEKIRLNPQPIELTEEIVNDPDFIFRMKISDIVVKPVDYSQNIWPLSKYENYLRTPGYVRYTDVKRNLNSLTEIIGQDISDFQEGDYVWTAFLSPPKLWSVYRFTLHKFKIDEVDYKNETLILTADILPDLLSGDILGIDNIPIISGFYLVDTVVGRKIYIKSKFEKWEKDLDFDSSIGLLYKFTEARSDSIDNLNSIIPDRIKTDETVWVDSDDSNKRAVYVHGKIYKQNILSNPNLQESNLRFGKSITVSKNGLVAAVADAKQVTIFYKNPLDSLWKKQHTLSSFNSLSVSFADHMSISQDGTWLAILESLTTGQRLVHLYKKDNIVSEFEYKQTLINSSAGFGEVIALVKEYDQYVCAISNPIENIVYIYNVIDNADDSTVNTWVLTQNIVEELSNSSSSFGSSLDFDNSGSTLIIGAPGDSAVYVYERVSGGYDTTQRIYSDDKAGRAVAISGDGTKIAIGCIGDDSDNVDSGRVDLYKTSQSQFIKYQSIKSNNSEPYENFGYKVSFMNNDETLVIFSLNGDADNYTTFDSNTTFFDNKSLNLNDKKINSGRVDIFDRYKENYVFGESLVTNNTTDFSDNYGFSIGVGSNIILVGADKEGSVQDGTLPDYGHVFSYSKSSGDFSWTKKYNQADKVDIHKIKKAYLYDTETNELLTYLDVVDPIQGKIPGIADKEIKFKTFYDPATYNIGNNLVNVDDGQAWNKLQVGMLWWNLSTARFIENSLGNITYSSANWNKLYETSSIDIYEWVETKYKPSEWDALTNTDKGFSLGISGSTLYGNSVYSFRQTFDNVSQTFKSTYYFWVKNPSIVPNVSDRFMSALDVSSLIADPVSQGYPCISFIGTNSFILVNLINYIKAKNTNLNIEYWTVDSHYTKSNSHSQWKLISLDEKTVIPRDIEIKWIDSLLGKDSYDRIVPNPKIPIKKRYGLQNRPRQGMFINRLEALKQFIEYVNKIFKTKIIVDDYDISPLFDKDPIPSIASGLYDVQIDTIEERRFVNVGLVSTAELSPVLKDGRLVDVDIVYSGYGYKNPPRIYVLGTGSDAELKAEINSVGQVVSVNIINPGNNYSNISMKVRSFSILVSTDSSIGNAWAIYEYNNTWSRVKSQGYNTELYWDYIDWYADGVNQFNKLDYLVKNTYELYTLQTEIGQIVKVENVGTGGWLLLEKYNNNITLDYTQNYKVIGRQNGTIQLKTGLYDFSDEILGYDTNLFDTQLYDNIPVKELKIILNVIKNNILVDDLYKHYLELFFNSLRYILSEQPFVDYILKTSFVKSKHNLGELQQKVTYKNDSLENFEDYIKEVKPYRTKIREYVSSYTRTENSRLSVTDFDLPSYIDQSYKVNNINLSIQDDSSIEPNLNRYPWKHWRDNVGFKVNQINIVYGGSGYIFNPVVRIIGNCKKPAIAKAYISAGRVNRIQILDSGSGYLETPTIILDGGLSEIGQQAKASVIIESDVVRTVKTAIKFDRLSRNNSFDNLTIVESFVATGSQVQFVLKFAPNIEKDTYSLTLNGLEALKDDYKISVKSFTTDGETRYSGILTLETAPARNVSLELTYQIGFEHLNSLDRIQHFYNPTTTMLGKDFAQLLTGVDYGGVDIQGLVNFVGTGGWDSDGWGESVWGEEDFDFTDQIFTIGDNSSYGDEGEFKFNYVPSIGQQINVYLKKLIAGSINDYTEIRLDDPNFGTSGFVSNLNAVMPTIVGDGITDTFELPNPTSVPPLELEQGDIIIFRKSISDGSKSPKPQDYDTQLSGGNLIYTSATGVNPDDINVDGDGLVTPVTSYAPEEVVPGQVVDTLALKVYQLPTGSSAKIFFKNFIADGIQNNFNLAQFPQNTNAVIVKVGYVVKKNQVDYTFNWQTKNVELTSVPPSGSVVSVIGIGYSSERILDVDYFVSDGSTVEYITSAPYVETLGSVVLVNGNAVEYELFETDSMYSELYRVGIRLASPAASNSIITYLLTDDENYSASIVKSEQITTDGSSLEYMLDEPIGIDDPKSNSVIVIKNGEILSPGLSEYFNLENNVLSYTLSKYEQGPGTVDTNKIEVFVNGNKKQVGLDYTIDLNGISIILNPSTYVDNAVMVVVNTTNSEYTISNDRIRFFNIFSAGTVIDVISFYNHNVLEIVRTEESLKSFSSINIDTPDYYRYKSLKGGKFSLFKKITVDDYLWVIKNNKMLSHGLDYYLDTDCKQVILSKGLDDADVLDVIVFGSGKATEGYAFMQFKDILNRSHYKRLNKDKTTRLTNDLTQFDINIHVENASNLDVPDISLNLPGIIEINGERIEYFEIDGNILKRLRRSTLGTGSSTVHKRGTLVVNLGNSETIPYMDSQIMHRIVTTEVVNSLILPFEVGVESKEIASQTDQDGIEIFVGGKRLKKRDYSVFNITNEYPYSPEGDTVNLKEFTVVGNTVSFTKTVGKGVEILVTKKIGKIWEDIGNTTIHNSTTPQAKFILAAQPFYPEYTK